MGNTTALDVTSQSIKGWLPGNAVNSVTYNIPANANLVDGENYELQLALVYHNASDHIIPIAIKGKSTDGWYPLETVKIKGGHTNPTTSLRIEALTNGEDTDTTPGPMLTVGNPVTWTYEVTNTGNVPLHNIRVFDRQGISGVNGWNRVCLIAALEPGAIDHTCSASDTVRSGQNRRDAAAQGFDSTNPRIKNNDHSYYTGS